MLAYKKKMEA